MLLNPKDSPSCLVAYFKLLPLFTSWSSKFAQKWATFSASTLVSCYLLSINTRLVLAHSLLHIHLLTISTGLTKETWFFCYQSRPYYRLCSNIWESAGSEHCSPACCSPGDSSSWNCSTQCYAHLYLHGYERPPKRRRIFSPCYWPGKHLLIISL